MKGGTGAKRTQKNQSGRGLGLLTVRPKSTAARKKRVKTKLEKAALGKLLLGAEGNYSLNLSKESQPDHVRGRGGRGECTGKGPNDQEGYSGGEQAKRKKKKTRLSNESWLGEKGAGGRKERISKTLATR